MLQIRRRDKFWTGCRSIAGHTHHFLTHSYLGAVYSHPFNLICMFFWTVGGNPERANAKIPHRKAPSPELNREHSCSEETVLITAQPCKNTFLLSNVLPITRMTWLPICLLLGSVTGYFRFGSCLFPLIHTKEGGGVCKGIFFHFLSK